jgi:hypothetical protein
MACVLVEIGERELSKFIERNNRIAKWAEENPCSSCQEIGDYYGITRERVSQILRMKGIYKESAATARMKIKPRIRCDMCGKEVKTDRRKNRTYAKAPRCHECRSLKVTLVCSGCGTKFERPLGIIISGRNRKNTRYKYERVFCSRECSWKNPSEALIKSGTENLRRHHAKKLAEKTEGE